MKLDITSIPDLLKKHIYDLTEDELHGLAFIISLEISEYHKNSHQVEFKLANNGNTGFLECGHKSNFSMGKKRLKKNGESAMWSWGGCFNFIDVVDIFKTFIARGYEITMQSPEKLKVYTKDEWQVAFGLIFNAIFGQK